jgi:hypothetical protein
VIRVRAWFISVAEYLWKLLPDKCEVCHGDEGGVRGNENILDGILMCDYCHVKALKRQRYLPRKYFMGRKDRWWIVVGHQAVKHPFRHKTKQSAIAEAERLASQFGLNQAFFVYHVEAVVRGGQNAHTNKQSAQSNQQTPGEEPTQ